MSINGLFLKVYANIFILFKECLTRLWNSLMYFWNTGTNDTCIEFVKWFSFHHRKIQGLFFICVYVLLLFILCSFDFVVSV